MGRSLATSTRTVLLAGEEEKPDVVVVHERMGDEKTVTDEKTVATATGKKQDEERTFFIFNFFKDERNNSRFTYWWERSNKESKGDFAAGRGRSLEQRSLEEERRWDRTLCPSAQEHRQLTYNDRRASRVTGRGGRQEDKL